MYKHKSVTLYKLLGILLKNFFLKGCYNVAHNSFKLTLMMENEANCINEKSRRKESTLNCFPGYKFINDAIKTSIKWFSENLEDILLRD